jgi:hypothetical protein
MSKREFRFDVPNGWYPVAYSDRPVLWDGEGPIAALRKVGQHFY